MVLERLSQFKSLRVVADKQGMRIIRQFCGFLVLAVWLISFSAHFAMAAGGGWLVTGLNEATAKSAAATKEIDAQLGPLPKTLYVRVPEVGQQIRECASRAQTSTGNCWRSFKTSVEKSAAEVGQTQAIVTTAKGAASALEGAKPPIQNSYNAFSNGLSYCTSQLSETTCTEDICSTAVIDEKVEQAKKKVVTEAESMQAPENQQYSFSEHGKIELEKERAYGELSEINRVCTANLAKVRSAFSSGMQEVTKTLGSMDVTRDQIKAAMGESATPEVISAIDNTPKSTGAKIVDWVKENPGKTAAIAGGAGLLGYMALKKDKKDKDDDKNGNGKVGAEQKEKEFQNGYAYNSLGERVNCLTNESYMSGDCKPVMLNFCGKKENTAMNACATFTGTYCAQSSASQSFCMAQQARTFCEQQSGPYSASTPACQWIAARPSNCVRQPEGRACLYNSTAAKITASCPSFPNDPLCSAFKEGKDILQVAPTQAETAAAENADIPGADNESGRASLNALVATDQSSVTGNVNLLGDSSEALAALCKAGQLIHCK